MFHTPHSVIDEIVSRVTLFLGWGVGCAQKWRMWMCRPLPMGVGLCTESAAHSVVWVKAGSQSCTPEPNMDLLDRIYVCVSCTAPCRDQWGMQRSACSQLLLNWQNTLFSDLDIKKSFWGSSMRFWNSTNWVHTWCSVTQDPLLA